MKFIYDSWQKKHKEPFGAVKRGTEIWFAVESDADRVFLLGFGEKRELKKNGDCFGGNIKTDIDCGLMFYSFEAIYGGEIIFIWQKRSGWKRVRKRYAVPAYHTRKCRHTFVV